jgi:predicted dehydrogenase
MSVKVRTAVIGVGRWGQNVARDLATVSELVAYTSRSGGPNAFMPAHTSARPCTLEEVAADPAIRAVAIATPTATHAAVTRTMLLAGKHVFVEKPLAYSSAEAYELVDLAAARDLTLATGYQFLCHPVYEELKRRIDVRGLRHVTLTWRKWGTFGEPIEFSLLTHHLGLAIDLLGEPRAGTLQRLGRVESECDSVETQLVYPNTQVVSLIDRGSRVASHTLGFDLEDGSAYLWTGRRLLHLEEPEAEPAVVFETRELPLAIEIARFVAAVAGEKPTLPSAGDFGARVLTVQERLQDLK